MWNIKQRDVITTQNSSTSIWQRKNLIFPCSITQMDFMISQLWGGYDSRQGEARKVCDLGPFFIFHLSDKSPIMTIKCCMNSPLSFKFILSHSFFLPFFRPQPLLSPLFTFQSCFRGDRHVLALILAKFSHSSGLVSLGLVTYFFCCNIIKQETKDKKEKHVTQSLSFFNSDGFWRVLSRH